MTTILNKERLENNKKSNLDHINSVVQLKPVNNPNIDDLTTKLDNIVKSNKKNLLSSEDFKNAILTLEELRDARQNIAWHKFDHADGTKSLVRDARKLKGGAPNESNDSYLINALNIVRASLDVIEIEKKIVNIKQSQDSTSQLIETQLEKAKKDINKALNDLYSDYKFVITKDDYIDIPSFNGRILQILKDAGIEDPLPKLSAAKDFANFKDEHFHVSTITTQQDSKNQDRIVVESDVMLLGLTDLQKAQYLAIHNSKDGAEISLKYKNEDVDMSWYNKQPLYIKYMIKENALEILSGKKVLPTQLRNRIIGMRNAFNKVTYIESSRPGSNKFEVAVETYHSGTITSHINKIKENQNQEITNENVKQFQTFFGEGQKIILNVLNSPIKPTDIDASVERQSVKAVNNKELADNVGYAVTPINNLRKISSNNNQVFKNVIDSLSGFCIANLGIDLSLKTIISWDPNKVNSLEVLKKELQQQYPEKNKFTKSTPLFNELLISMTKLAKHIDKANSLMESNHAISDSQNSNVDLASEMKIIEYEVNKLRSAMLNYLKTDKKIPETEAKKLVDNICQQILTFCASGKDRTGLVETETSRKAITEKLGLNQEVLKEKRHSRGSKLEYSDNDNNNELSESKKQQIVKENFAIQVAAGHTQFMASVDAGTRGSHGIKNDTLDAFPEFYKDNINGLSQKTASYNKVKFDEESKFVLFIVAISSLMLLFVPVIIYAIYSLINKPLEINHKSLSGDIKSFSSLAYDNDESLQNELLEALGLNKEPEQAQKEHRHSLTRSFHLKKT